MQSLCYDGSFFLNCTEGFLEGTHVEAKSTSNQKLKKKGGNIHLLTKDGLRLTTISFLLSIVTPFSLTKSKQ
jgi:hypothetical protein